MARQYNDDDTRNEMLQPNPLITTPELPDPPLPPEEVAAPPKDIVRERLMAPPPPPPAPVRQELSDDELVERILSRKRDSDLIANIGSVGATLDKGMGGDGDTGFYDKLSKQNEFDASARLGSLDLRRKLMASKGKDMASPGSPDAEWATLQQSNPAYANAIGRDAFFAADLKARAGILKEAGVANRFGETDKDRDRGFEFKEGESERDQVNKDRAFAAGEDARSAVQARFDGTQLAGYSKAINDLVPLTANLQEIDNIQPGLIRGKADGLTSANWFEMKAKGALPKGLGTQLEPAQESKLRSATLLLAQRYVRPMAGANFTESEQAQFAKILNDALLAGPEAQAAAIDLIRRETHRKLVEKESAYRTIVSDPAVWKAYQTIGGLTSNDPVFSDLKGNVGEQVGPARGAPQAHRQAPAPRPARSPEDEAAFSWAQGHPQDPRAAEILKRLGAN